MCLLWESKLLGLTVDRSGLILLSLTIPSPIIFLVVYVLFKPSNQVIQPLDKNVLLKINFLISHLDTQENRLNEKVL